MAVSNKGFIKRQGKVVKDEDPNVNLKIVRYTITRCKLMRKESTKTEILSRIIKVNDTED